MPQQISNTLLSWASDLDPKAAEQADRTAAMPFIHGHVALMPDAHYGLGATVGSVIPTLGAIIPAAVGVDIGCGMIAVETNLEAKDLPEDLDGLLHRIERAVPSGVGKGRDLKRRGERETATHRIGALGSPATDLTVKQKDTVRRQLGSLGSGNHFVEVCLDERERVWVVLHSGSRGIGNQLARRHIDVAKGLMREYLVSLPDPDLAYLTEGTPPFDAYITDLHWAQEYALANRETMMDAVLAAMRLELGRSISEGRRINCHHNYTARETHFGKDVWVSRKGAIRARSGDYGVIPGSMGTSSFIVRGLGNPESLESSAHGAGRRMSRRAAKRDLTVASLEEAMAGKTWLADRPQALLDEHPDAYKDIQAVMRDQADLVEIELELHQILNYKGT